MSVPSTKTLSFEDYEHYLKPRPRDWHKGLSGHVLIVGGDLGFSGAPRLAALAALRVGAGLVTVATHPQHADLINIECPELMAIGARQAEPSLLSLLAKAKAVVLGPGLGQSAWSQDLFHFILHSVKQTATPLVLDADGLNLLAKHKQQYAHWVLTPHPAEAGRLLECSVETIQKDRLLAALTIQQHYAGICVLKGAGTLIAAPSSPPGLCTAGNPGMASAGMGDVLSGVIGGLLAQGIPLADAAALGVVLHAKAGDLAAQQGERGTIASDLLPHLRQLCNVPSHT